MESFYLILIIEIFIYSSHYDLPWFDLFNDCKVACVDDDDDDDDTNTFWSLESEFGLSMRLLQSRDLEIYFKELPASNWVLDLIRSSNDFLFLSKINGEKIKIICEVYTNIFTVWIIKNLNKLTIVLTHRVN